MSNIIPGLPTPQTGDLTCVLSQCARLIAQVDCIAYIMQGTTACIGIQLFSGDGQPLDLRGFSQIQALLFDELDCTAANYWWPQVPSECRGFELEILQTEDTAGHIQNGGLIRLCLDSSCTGRSPGSIFAELRLTEDPLVTGQPAQVYGIKCIWVAVIQKSKIWSSGCNEGCSPLT